MKPLFGLLDCNNFYVSCERVFQPKLNQVPVIVLSNNDGCAIARSNEAKSLGIKMGDPLFKIRDLVQREGVRVFSSNYTLYADMSRRVVETMSSLVPEIEIYSIDESFLDLSPFPAQEVVVVSREVRERVRQWTGIPTCVGIAPTKTLAKLANWLAKKRPEFNGVCDLRSREIRAELLPTVPVEEVWGIGKASVQKLAELGVTNAAQLASLDPGRARRLLTVVGGRIAYELQGHSCLPLEMLAPTRKGIAVTRSFGKPVTTWREMSEALMTYASRAGEKLRQHQVATYCLTAFMHTSCFKPEEPWYANSAMGSFVEATHDTLQLTEMAVQLGERIWRDGYQYAKAGIMLTELVKVVPKQLSFLQTVDVEKRDKLWQTVDQVNQQHGRESVRLLGSGLTRKWKVRAEHQSPRWTTQWQDIPVIQL